MSISLTFINAVAGLVKAVNYLVDKVSIFLRNRRIKKEYKDADKAVKKGDIDRINDILR